MKTAGFRSLVGGFGRRRRLPLIGLIVAVSATLTLGPEVRAAEVLAYAVVDCTRPGEQFVLADAFDYETTADAVDVNGAVVLALQRRIWNDGAPFRSRSYIMFTVPPGTEYTAVRFTNDRRSETQAVEPAAEPCTATAINAGTADPGLGLTAIEPKRLLDSRLITNANRADTMVAAGSVVEVAVLGKAGIPSTAGAVYLNVAAVQPQAVGHLRVFPCGGQLPKTSNLNFVAGETRAANVFVKPGENGSVCIYTTSHTHLLVDAQGFVPAGSQPVAIAPVRVADTRAGAPVDGPGLLPKTKVNGYAQLDMTKLAGVGGIPADAKSFVVNVTATNAAAGGYVTVNRCPTGGGGHSTVNFSPGRAAANLAFSAPAYSSYYGADYRVCVYTRRPVDLIVDVVGYSTSVYAAPRALNEGLRMLETRPAPESTWDMTFTGHGPLRAGVEYKILIGGRPRPSFGAYEIPRTMSVVLNVTAIRPLANGHVTVFECGKRPSTSNLNVSKGDTVANSTLVRTDRNGDVCLHTSVDTDLAIDVVAYSSPRNSPTLFEDSIELRPDRPSEALSIVDGAPPYTVSGTLPAPSKISIDDDGVISYTGAPDAYTYYYGQLTVTDAKGRRRAFNVTIVWFPKGADAPIQIPVGD